MQKAPVIQEMPVDSLLLIESPPVPETIKHLPPHFAEHVGEKALQLTHTDMHPVTVYGSGEEAFTDPDYSRRILDSDRPEEEFEHSSVEAAQAGKEKLARVLHESATTLAEAHAVLVENGYNFEPPADESPEDEIKRHAQEKIDIAACAYHIAAERAIDFKRSGNQQAAIEQLEALNAIVYLGPSEFGDKASKRTSRNLVHEGLANEMLTALQESGKISAGSYERVGRHDIGQKTMLELATGKELDYDFTVVGDLDIERLRRLDSPNLPLEIMTIITSPHIEMSEDTRRQLLDKTKNWRVYPKIKEKLDALQSYGDGSVYYDLAETCEGEEFINPLEYVFGYDDPLALQESADKLGLSLLDAGTLLGKQVVTDFDRHIFNTQAAEELAVLAEKHPFAMHALLQDTKSRGYGRESYASLVEALDTIEGVGIRDEGVVRTLVAIGTEGLESATVAIKGAFEYAEKNGYSQAEFYEKMRHGEHGDGFYYILMKAIEATDTQAAESSEDTIEARLEDAIENIMVDSCVRKAYLSLYEQVGYPASPEKISSIRLGIESFPEIAEQLESLGMSASLTEDMFAAWATYNALQVHGYSNEAGFQSVDVVPEGIDMDDILRRQANAIKSQLVAVKKYHAEFGEQELKQVIDVFGIYNFSRHKPASLHDQLDRWNSGQAVETVVADARADWNNYSGKQIKFEDESAKTGVFYFEVNSATKLSKLAVSLGQRERQLGREPNISRFVIHAHGKATGMLLGVNDEHLNTYSYTQAAQRRTKISGTESNDYKRHLGPNYTVILQTCSGAGETSGKNIASTISDELGVPVTGAEDTISALTIASDGSVLYTSHGDGVESVTY